MAEIEQEQKTKSQNKNERTAAAAFVFWLLLSILLVFADQYASGKLFGMNLGSGALKLGPFRNYDFAFSLQLPKVVIYTVYLAVLGASMAYCIRRWKNLGSWERLAWVLIGCGAFANIAERIMYGFVRDYIYIFSGIFNIADLYILAGIALLLLAT